MRQMNNRNSRSIHVNKRHFMSPHKRMERFHRQLHRMDAILMQFLQCLGMFLVHHLPLLSIPPGEYPALSLLVQLPLFDIFRNILSIGAEGIPHVHADKVAVQVHERDVEIESNLRLIVLVEGDARGHDGTCEGNGFGEEEYGHDGYGADGHYGAECGGLERGRGR